MLFFLLATIGLLLTSCSDVKQFDVENTIGSGKVESNSTSGQMYVVVDSVPYYIDRIRVPEFLLLSLERTEPIELTEGLTVTLFKDRASDKVIAVMGVQSAEQIEEMFTYHIASECLYIVLLLLAFLGVLLLCEFFFG